MTKLMKKAKTFLKVKTFFKAEMIILGSTFLILNVFYYVLCGDIRKDTKEYRNEIANIQTNIIEKEFNTFKFITDERGSIVNDSLSYEEYEIIISDFKEIFHDNMAIDSLMNEKLYIKDLYINNNIKKTPISKIKIDSNKDFIIGDPMNHINIDTNSYTKSVRKNLNNHISDQNELLLENTKIDKLIFEILIIDIQNTILMENKKVNELKLKVDNNLKKIQKISIIHTIIGFIMIFIILSDVKKIFKKNKRKDDVINKMIEKNIKK